MSRRHDQECLSTNFIVFFLNRHDPSGRLYVAYSGGVDSHVLLHLCSLTAFKEKITAVYVHHGLQPEAEAWAMHCEKTAASLGVDFKVLRVNAIASRGESPEEAARNARYSALKAIIEVGDALLLAQHQEDQLETVLLQLFRGSGLRGLSGMPECIAFGQGMMLRPMLQVSKTDIIHYAIKKQLSWVEDLSNQKSDFDRNFLRNEILPLVKQRWPSIDKTVARSARHCADAEQLLNESMQNLFDFAYDTQDRTLNIEKLNGFTANQRNWVLRNWFETLRLKPPSQSVLRAIAVEVLHAREDANPQIQIQGHFIKRYQQKLYCLAAENFQKKPIIAKIWPSHDHSVSMNGYQLSRIESSSGISKEIWHASVVTVSTRQGGEKIKLPDRKGHHELKKLYQQARIPPWEREVRPLVFLDNRLAAVAELWIAEWAWSESVDNCYQIRREINIIQ
ncbi:MAG: tRNA lysidine(34) synthetase TilS [Methylococcaceae bacterium]|nr:tRNA lysidine(34) synthetase TilS [Methylococcaceae bacterium]